MAGVSTFSEEVAEKICERIAEGESLSRICRDESMPHKSTICKWLKDITGFSDQYARAKEMCADTFFDQIGEIANDGAADWVMSIRGAVLDQEHVQRSRLRVDALKWQASKLAPKKYGDKLQQEVTGADGGPIQAAVTIEFVRPKA